MKKAISSVVLFFYVSVLCAGVSLHLEAPKVGLNQTFSLTITIDNNRVNVVPDLMPLQKEFTVVGTESNINYTVVNGQSKSTSEWTVLLNAKHKGVLEIPALQVGSDKTIPTRIEVTDDNAAAAEPEESLSNLHQDVMIVAESSTTSPFVNQQVIYTVKLFTNSRLLDANYLPPQVEDALFIPFGTGRRYQVNKGEQLYSVEEQQFALFPQKSGDLNITPPSFNALIYDLKPRRVNAKADTVVLKVKAIPEQFKDKDWLPAKQISLTESYDNKATTFTEGNTLVRLVTLEAVALPAQLLPKLNFGTSDNYSVYPSSPVEKNAFNQEDLVGTATVKVTYLLNKAGVVTIPPVSLTWFNTVTGKEESSALPALTLQVNSLPGANKTPKKPISDASLVQKSPSFASPAPLAEKTTNRIILWLMIAFLFAWLITLFAWFKARSASSPSPRNSFKALKEACLQNNPGEARNALMQWVKAQWPKAHILNLVDIEHLMDDAECKAEIHKLEQALYQGREQKTAWQGRGLWDCILKIKTTSVKKQSKDALPPIHRI
ncbi:MAG: BatD family protein [Tatlockia sp.]|jgi:hypothetical protein